MTNMNLKNLAYYEADVGKSIKSTKKHFTWEFTLDEKQHKIELYDSKLSGKKKVVIDGKVFTETEEEVAFSKSFEIANHSCTVIQHGEKFELRIDNQSYSHMMDLEKNKIFFSSSSNPTSTTYVTKSTGNDGKVGFGIASNWGSQPKDVKPGMFNFAIKPVTENKQFTENSNHQFKVKSGEERGSANSHSTTGTNNTGKSNLIDFGASETVTSSNGERDSADTHQFFQQLNNNNNSNNNQNTSNTKNVNPLDILNGLDFTNNSPNVNTASPTINNNNGNMNNNVFDLVQTGIPVGNNNYNNNFGNFNNNNQGNFGNFQSQSNYGQNVDTFNKVNNINQGNFNNQNYPQFESINYNVNAGNNTNMNMIQNNNGNTNYNNKNVVKDPLQDLFG